MVNTLERPQKQICPVKDSQSSTISKALHKTEKKESKIFWAFYLKFWKDKLKRLFDSRSCYLNLEDYIFKTAKMSEFQ